MKNILLKNPAIILFYAGSIASAIAQYKTGQFSYAASAALAGIATLILILAKMGKAN